MEVAPAVGPQEVKTSGKPQVESKEQEEVGCKEGKAVEEKQREQPVVEEKERERPNYFLSIPLATAKMQGAFEAVQTKLSELDPHFARSFTEKITAHITLAVLRLDEPQVEAAARVLRSLKDRILDAAPESLHFGGLGHFRNEVLFFEISEDAEKKKLEKLTELVRDAFVKEGLLAADDSESPLRFHVTVAKMSRLQRSRRQRGAAKAQRLRKFPTDIFGTCSDVDAGRIEKIQVQLCRMGGRPKGEYYCVVEEIDTTAG